MSVGLTGSVGPIGVMGVPGKIGIAMVKSTGETLEITSHYEIKTISVDIKLPDGLDIDLFNKYSGITFSHNYEIDTTKEGGHWTLSDGNKYTDDELIVGVENIRDYKISKINE
jgi:hypothetical protein